MTTVSASLVARPVTLEQLAALSDEIAALSRMLVEFDVMGPWIVDLYDAAARHSEWLGPLLPLAFAVWLGWAWYRSGLLAEGRELHPLLTFGAVGTLARLQRASRLASLAD